MRTTTSLLDVAIVLTLLFCGSAFAQDQTCDCDCTAVEQARSLLEKEVAEHKTHLHSYQDSASRLTAELERAHSEVASLKAKQDAEATAWASQVSSLQQQNADIKAASQASLAEQQSLGAAQVAKAQLDCKTSLAQLKEEHALQLAALASQMAALQQQIATLQQQLSNTKCTTNMTQVITELAASTKDYVTSAAKCTIDEVKLVVAGLQQGNTSQLTALTLKISTAVVAQAKAGYSLASHALDEHLPFVKQRSADAWQKGSELYDKHVGNAAWVAEVKKYVGNVNTELKSFLTAQIKAQPALKTLDDPVYIQLLAYMVIGAPLLLLFLPVLLLVATLAAPATKSPSASTGKGSKKAKAKANKAAGTKK